ncbi:MAG: Stp1/IreP family PP2C-type Ser/Thr phosphatase [Thermoflexaceae bacterium]|nr:Stp1/IreP family PP2C-type Ser/Thr phosphatase [Thermoflexaceae bacterium]
MKAYSATDVGKVRKVNQDTVFCSTDPVGNLPNLFIVADGMGGHKAGDLASRLTVETVVDMVQSLDDSDPITLIGKAIHRANEVVLGKAREAEEFNGMGTTVVVSCIKDGMLYVANVGDSRLYVINKEIKQITRDHSLVEELVSMGQLDRKEARTNKNKNIITRAVGGMKVVMADYFEIQLEEKDMILMCTDGLTNMVEDEEIMGLVKQKASIEVRVANLIQSANNHGGRDNVGVILVES